MAAPSALSAWLLLLPLSAAALAAAGLQRWQRPVAEPGGQSTESRQLGLDGLRGLLALSVVLHHATIWYFYLRTGRWEVPPSRLHTQLGQVGVLMFFMITAMLFHLRLLQSPQPTGPDWIRLYKSRILRLVPLYLLTMVAMLALIGWRSDWTARVPLPELLRSTAAWLLFTLPGIPNINGLPQTFVLTAGVTWSLPYEWLWYALLPLIALVIGRRPSRPWLLFGLLALSSTALWHPRGQPLLGFLGGIAAAWVMHRFGPDSPWARLSRGPWGSWLTLVCLTVSLTGFESAYQGGALLFVTLAFSLICSGSTLFGLLTHPVSRWLGDRAYGLYLLHGLLLSILFVDGLGQPRAADLSPLAHWGWIAALMSVLIFIADLGHRLVERPAMRLMRSPR